MRLIARKITLPAMAALLVPLLAGGLAMAEEKEGKYNRLINEKSPYLLKHARNPIDWYPWGEEAFERAKKEDKPIFLSIGYSTCHWCNVMEEESFSDPEVAALLNETFVSIKVDREERPDIDNVYMSVCVLLTGSGGWPLTIMMTPERKPFFAGTYIPKHNRFGRTGLMELAGRVKKLWAEQREEVLKSAESITSALSAAATDSPGEELGQADLKAAYDELRGRYDPEMGGFGQAPKFPTPHNLMFLLRYWRRTGEEEALRMVQKTLAQMRFGGMYDHLGLGFHRYSTDRQWLVPHFEKMLYDQAMLALAYLEAFQATKDESLAATAREIFAYVLRDMTSPEGGFYSAEGADSEGEEGKFYVWRQKEIEDALGEEGAEFLSTVFNVTEEGNFVEPLRGERTGQNILHLKKPPAQLAGDFKMAEEEFAERLEGLREKLFEARKKRVHPDKDDKVLTDWNGLMIAALARGAQVLREPRYLDAARRAADFVLLKMRDGKGRLLHRWRGGDAGIGAKADDYAFLIWGLLELYEAGFDARHLEAALELQREFISQFWDEGGGGFYFSPYYGEPMIVKIKDIYDGAVPSGNSVAMLNLLRLGRLTGNSDFEEKASRLSRAFSERARQSPSAYTMLLSAVDFGVGPAHEVVVVGREGAKDTGAMLGALAGSFVPNKVVLFVAAGKGKAPVLRYAGYAEHMEMAGGKATAYVCTNYNCKLPTTDAGEMLRLLGAADARQ